MTAIPASGLLIRAGSLARLERAPAAAVHHVFLSHIRSPFRVQNITTPSIENRIAQQRHQIGIQTLRREVLAKLWRIVKRLVQLVTRLYCPPVDIVVFIRAFS